MEVGASRIEFAAMKKPFENNYKCMGINRKMFGGLWNKATKDQYKGVEPKKDKSTSVRNNLAI